MPSGPGNPKAMKPSLLRTTLGAMLGTLAAGLHAQAPTRTVGLSISPAEDGDFPAAFGHAQAACLDAAHIFFTWSDLEPSPGVMNATLLANMDALNTFFPFFNTRAELQLAVTNTLVKEVPADLMALPFDDPQMIARFRVLLDTVMAHLPDLELRALNIGNESDGLFGTDPLAYQQFRTFLDSVIPHAEQLYFDSHGLDLVTGTTLMWGGLTNPATSALCHALVDGLDVVSVTYYGIESDFTVKDPIQIPADLALLVQEYPDTVQPIHLVECGYPSSAQCSSSEMLQSQFVEQVFTAWDPLQANIRFISFFHLTDWSAGLVDTLANYYGVQDTTFKEFLRTIGLRTWPGSGAPKPAYHTLLCELNERGFCTAPCTTSSPATGPGEPVTASPNPFFDAITLSLPAGTDRARYRMLDMTGALVASGGVDGGVIHPPALHAGCYMLVVTNDAGDRLVRTRLIRP